MTTYELLEQAKAHAARAAQTYNTAAQREFELAVTHIEDAQLRYNRGIAAVTQRPLGVLDLEARQDA